MRNFIFLSFLFFSSALFALPAHRIITLAPNLTEITFAAGAGKYLVGRDSRSDYPAAAKKIPIIANFQSIDLERIEKLHPDLIIAWQYTNALILNQLRELKVPIYIAKFYSISDISKNIKAIGVLTGTADVANRAARHFDRQLIQLKKKQANRKPITVFYQLSQQPLITLNNHSLVNQVIQLCGGKNIFEKTAGLAPVISIENVLKENPQVILVSGFDKPNLNYWNQYPQLVAVKKKQIYTVNSDLLERAGPRILQGVWFVCNKINDARKLHGAADQ